MKNRRPTIILCGPQVSHDKILKNLLFEKYNIVCIDNSDRLVDTATRNHARLVIVEFLHDGAMQLDFMKNLKEKLDKTVIVVVTDKENVLYHANILIAGASDIFPIPYKLQLIVERVDGLLKVFSQESFF